MSSIALSRYTAAGLLAGLLFVGCGPSGNSNSPTGGTGATGSSGAGSESTGAGTELKSDLLAPAELAKLSGKIQIDGSSSLFPVSEAVGEDFQIAVKKKVQVPIAHAGTGGGMKRFVRGEIDICDASRPISESEMAGCKEAGIEFIELPVCFDALTIVVHPSNKLNSITVDQLKTIWEPDAEKKVVKWNQVDPTWPDSDLRLFGAGSDSGTFDYFTEATVGKARSSRKDYNASEDDNTLVQGVKGDAGALGYIPFAYYTENTKAVKALAVDWEKDDLGPVEPTLENVLAAKYNPLSRPLFLYVNRKSADRPEVKAFVEYYIVNATKLVTEVKYMPLPGDEYQLVLNRFRELKVGSAFKGAPEVGVKIQDILAREVQ